MTGPLPPPAALAFAARLLAAQGWAEVARNDRDDSLYLARPGCTYRMRLSNHARTARQRARRHDVLTSLVIRAPRHPAQVADLVAAALRDFEAALARRPAQAAGASEAASGRSSRM